MKIGIPLSWPQQASAISPEVVRVARMADDAGMDSLWTTDPPLPDPGQPAAA